MAKQTDKDNMWHKLKKPYLTADQKLDSIKAFYERARQNRQHGQRQGKVLG